MKTQTVLSKSTIDLGEGALSALMRSASVQTFRVLASKAESGLSAKEKGRLIWIASWYLGMAECGGVRYSIDSMGRVEVKTEDQRAERAGRIKVLRRHQNYFPWILLRKIITYLDRKASVILSVEATSKKSRDIPGEVSDGGKMTHDKIEWRGAQFRILQIWGIIISCTLNR